MSRVRRFFFLLGLMSFMGVVTGCSKSDEPIPPPKNSNPDAPKIPASGGGAPEAAHK